MICLALIPVAVQHHPHGSLHLVLLVVLGQPGLAAAGVSEGGDGSNLAHHRTGAGIQWCQLADWLIPCHLHWGILLGQKSFHSKPSCPHGSLANSHLGTRESSKRGLDDGLVVDEGGEDFVAGGLPLRLKHADGLAEAEFTLKNLPKDLSVHSYS